jgi:hypothetical protein
MDVSYVVLCGAMWSQFGDEDAGHELIRALSCSDPEVRILARAMLQQADMRSKVLIGEALANKQISPVQAGLCAFEKKQKSKLTHSLPNSLPPSAAA